MHLRAMALFLALLNWLTGCAAHKPTDPRYFKGKEAALESAIYADSRQAIAKAVAAGANVNARGAQQRTPVMLAVDYEKRQALAELLARGADSNAKAIDGHSPVSLAVENYKLAPDIFFAVMRNGGNPNTLRPNEDPILMRFVNDRNCEFIRHMKGFGANLDALTRTEDPIIVSAALGTDWDVVWCLLELGAKYNYESSMYPLSRLLASRVPSADSPIFPYKKKVWEFLRDHGIAVPPLKQS